MITLFGATGYTGRLTAFALDQAGLPFRIAGRSATRLAALSEILSSKPSWVEVDIGYTQSIPSLFKDTRLIINCVGPFTDLGEKILGQAAVSGVHYLDTNNELGFVYRIQSYQRLAQQSKAAVVPSCAFEVALADCAIKQLMSDGVEPYDDIHIVYHLKGQKSSPGTRRSALRSLATSWVVYRDGHWVGQAPGTKTHTFTYSGRKFHSFAIPSCESVTIPMHTRVKSINTWMTVTPFQAFLAPIAVPYFARFLRSIAGPWLQKSIGRSTPKPGEILSAPEPFQILIFMHRKKEPAQAIRITGEDPYGITARILVEAAFQLLKPDCGLAGILPPSAVLGGSDFFISAQKWGIKLQGAP